MEARHLTKEIDIKLGNSVWEVKPGYSPLSRFDNSLKKYIDPKHYARNKAASDYKFNWYDVNRNVPGFAFASVDAKMFEINGTKYRLLVSYLGPGKVGYFFEIQCGQTKPNFGFAKNVVPAVQDIYDVAYEINMASTAAVLAVGAFVATLLSPVFGDEPAGASAVAGAWATVKNVGLSASALSVLQGLTMQLGYAVP